MVETSICGNFPVAPPEGTLGPHFNQWIEFYFASGTEQVTDPMYVHVTVPMYSNTMYVSHTLIKME